MVRQMTATSISTEESTKVMLPIKVAPSKVPSDKIHREAPSAEPGRIRYKIEWNRERKNSFLWAKQQKMLKMSSEFPLDRE